MIVSIGSCLKFYSTNHSNSLMTSVFQKFLSPRSRVFNLKHKFSIISFNVLLLNLRVCWVECAMSQKLFQRIQLLCCQLYAKSTVSYCLLISSVEIPFYRCKGTFLLACSCWDFDKALCQFEVKKSGINIHWIE